MLLRRITVVLLALGLILVPLAASAKSFAPVPRLDSGDRSFLQVKVVKYTGGTNGKMIVEVRNIGPLPEKFAARGIYFVPSDVPIDDPERPPQRVVAAGPFENVNAKRTVNQVSVAPGKTVKLKLQVFCLDSHRPSPKHNQSFKVAGKRLPADLRAKIDQGTKGILKRTKGDLNAAKMAIQSYVWKVRAAKWMQLEGERANEGATRSAVPHSSHGGFYLAPPNQHQR
jgi:hypothetical protein